MKKLHVQIDGIWTAPDFIEYLSAVSQLYRTHLFTYPFQRDLPPAAFDKPRASVEASFNDGKTPESRESGSSISRPQARVGAVGFAPYTAPLIVDMARHAQDFVFTRHFLNGGAFREEDDEGWPDIARHLVVNRIEFASPGPTDFLGIAAGIEKLFGVFEKMISWRHHKELQDLERKERHAQIESLALDNMTKAIALLKETNFDEEQVKLLVSDQIHGLKTLDKLMDQERIIDVSILDVSDGTS